MHWGGLLIIALAACSTADSVDIQIHSTDRSVVSVELFVAGAPCTNCDGVAPPSATAKPAGPVNYLIGTDRFYAAIDSDGIAGFRLKPDAMDSTVPKLAAIGFDANGTPVGFVVDDTPFDLLPILGTKRRYELTLQPILQAAPHQATTEQVVTWRTESSDMNHPAQSCLAFLNHDGGNEFFVPEADPDCDGFVAPNECDPTWYKYMQPASTNPPECLADDMDGACQVGRSGTCIDGATAPTCTSLDKFCVPQVACTTCMPPYNQACLTSIATDVANGTRLRCTIPVFRDALNKPTTCLAGSDLINLDQYYASPCTVGFVQVGDSSGNIATSLDISTTNGDVVGTLDRTGYSQTCSFGFSTTITVTNLPANAAVQKGALAITTGGAETLLMPVVVAYVPGGPITDCASAVVKPVCEILPDTTSDTLWSCAAQH
jgi:hypothetical protein